MEDMTHVWKPSVTVAAIIERNHQFLMVEEHTRDGLRINQPAGHLEQGESLTDAIVRETLEESAYDFLPTSIVGIYMSDHVASLRHDIGTTTYLRFAFTGDLGRQHDRVLDTGIIRTRWMSYDELTTSRAIHRSALVLQCIDDYLHGQRTPLSILHAETSTQESHHG